MYLSLPLKEILPADLIVRHRQHIIDFLEMEGITASPELGETQLPERAVKELLSELAHDMGQQDG